ncbi:Hypothetical predicted protein [Cloeon dipterum]|uniref:Uncharacterized protein n=1 Tax=Cloeon dipterum TaxID=197152 RepID=A0A8S1DV94_9INSE|nr:Hypothetical predicted protein [Cloeon dipterum]
MTLGNAGKDERSPENLVDEVDVSLISAEAVFFEVSTATLNRSGRWRRLCPAQAYQDRPACLRAKRGQPFQCLASRLLRDLALIESTKPKLMRRANWREEARDGRYFSFVLGTTGTDYFEKVLAKLQLAPWDNNYMVFIVLLMPTIPSTRFKLVVPGSGVKLACKILRLNMSKLKQRGVKGPMRDKKDLGTIFKRDWLLAE